MALHRKRKEDEKRCYFCKDNITNKTAHGGYVQGGGKRCCEDCFPKLRKEEDRQIGLQHNSHTTLGEEQAYKRFGI